MHTYLVLFPVKLSMATTKSKTQSIRGDSASAIRKDGACCVENWSKYSLPFELWCDMSSYIVYTLGRLCLPFASVAFICEFVVVSTQPNVAGEWWVWAFQFWHGTLSSAAWWHYCPIWMCFLCPFIQWVLLSAIYKTFKIFSNCISLLNFNRYNVVVVIA